MRTINYKVSYEKLISRLPALFAYVEIDEQNTAKVIKATMGSQGDYGQIVADMTCPKFPTEEDVYTCYEGTQIKLSEGVHSYRTIIDIYYKVIEDIRIQLKEKWDEILKEYSDNKEPYPDFEKIFTEEKEKYEFIKFVEKGIGLKYVGLTKDDTEEETCGVNVTHKYPLAPDYIYLGDARSYYNKVIKIKKQLDFWENHTVLCKEDKKYYINLKNKFEMMNGEKLLSVLEELIVEAEEVATEYLGYAEKDNFPTINFKVNLTNTIKDLGMVTPYIQKWIPGKRYYHGDVVYYVDEYGYGLAWECDLENAQDKSEIKTDEMGRNYIEGHYDEESELIFFENGKEYNYGITIKTPEYWKVQSLNWVERNEHYICNECGREYHTQKDNCICGSDDFRTLKYVTEQTDTIRITGQCNTHLPSLRRYETYMNNEDQVELPKIYEDWLWYYRVGNIVNRETKYDEFGNVAVMYPNGDEVKDKDVVYPQGIQAIINDGEDIGVNIDMDGEYAINLALWGDIITSIKAENKGDYGILEFEYWIGAHLKAKKDDSTDNGLWYSIDDDGNYKYFFKDVTLDNDSKYGVNQGVKYTDSYIYYKGNTDMEVLRDFNEPIHYYPGDKISISEYNNRISEKNKPLCDPYPNDKTILYYIVREYFYELIKFEKGQIISYETYTNLTYDPEDEEEPLNNKKCKAIEENIWTLVDRGQYKETDKTYFEKYINGEFDKDFNPEGDVDDDDTNAPYYYKLKEKMVFTTIDNLYVYDMRVGHVIKKTPFFRTNFETNVDVRHIDIEDTPLIRYDYYNGVNFQPTINKNVYVERGVTQAFEKFIKFSEIKTFEDLENYANGGFFIMSKENINLG